MAVRRFVVQAGEQSEVALDHHVLILWEAQVAEFETYIGGRHIRCRNYPNQISAIVPGSFPAYRAISHPTANVCSLNPGFMARLEAELDRSTQGRVHGLADVVLSKILRLVIREVEDGLPSGRLYIESLSTALATRLLYLVRPDKPPEPGKFAALPRRPLHRVLDRMQSGINADLSLKTLAAEAGYSQSHFLRMFRAATGKTPHQYLLDLKLEKVKELLATRKLPLIDIAAACGFSSHSHLSTAFRNRFGGTPSGFARDLNRKFPNLEDDPF